MQLSLKLLIESQEPRVFCLILPQKIKLSILNVLKGKTLAITY